jgi:hypothetical protein
MKGTKEGVAYRLFASKMREDLYRSLKLRAVSTDKTIQTILEEAVTRYLADRRFSEEPIGVEGSSIRRSFSFDTAFINEQ